MSAILYAAQDKSTSRRQDIIASVLQKTLGEDFLEDVSRNDVKTPSEEYSHVCHLFDLSAETLEFPQNNGDGQWLTIKSNDGEYQGNFVLFIEQILEQETLTAR